MLKCEPDTTNSASQALSSQSQSYSVRPTERCTDY